MIQPMALSAALALGWSLLLTLGLVTVGILVATLFGSGNLAIVMAGPAELVLMVPAALMIAGVYGGSDRRRGLSLGPASGLELLVGASLGVILHLPTGYLSELVERRFPTPRAVLDAQLHALTPASSLMAVLILLSVAVVVPFAEELFFRGALFTPLLRSSPAFVASWTTSIGFALAHQEPRNWAPLLVVALVLGELRRLAGSIWPGVALHAAFNATTLLIVFVQRPVEIEPQAGSWLLAGIGSVLTLGAVWLFARVSARRRGAVS
jgi:membrane protease YdiL (CAAX protease family)